jgi:phosphate transport system substrate-binding protein
MPSRRLALSVVAALTICATGAICTTILSGQESRPPATRITGAGATFPYPIYSAWFAAYAQVRPDVQINYLANGSGAGIRQLSEQIVFFGATDTPMNEDEYQAALGRVLHLPTVVGAVAAIYNIPGFHGPLRLDGAVLAAIFLGRIRSWNDPALVHLNPGVTLPPMDITLIYRSDSSGTSYIVGDFLSKRSEEWRRFFGANRTLRPQVGIGIGARGSEGVSALVRQTPGALGYVELGYASRDRIDMARMQNASGAFVPPSVEGARAAAAAAVGRMPNDFRVSITNAPGEDVYPISSFTWMLLYQKPRDRVRAQRMVEFMRWALTDGQKLAPDLGYAPLPPEIVALEMTALETIRTGK